MRKELLDARGKHTQEEVANNIGITQKYLSKLELGQRTPSMVVAVKLSNYYNKPLQELFPDIFCTKAQQNVVSK